MACEYETVTEEDSELSKILLNTCESRRPTGYLKFGPEKVLMPKNYLQFKDAFDNFEVRPDDTWVISYPKAGTMWTQEMVWCIANDLDFLGAQENLARRAPFLDFTLLMDANSRTEAKPGEIWRGYKEIYSVSAVAQFKSPRFIRTHLPWQMLPKQLQNNTKKAKIVYVARNAKDVCLSYYHFSVTMGIFGGDFGTFSKLFLADMATYSPFWSHIMDFWKRRDQENILFLKFEDMKKDLPSVIRQTADFLGKTFTETQVTALADHLSFAKMKDNTAVNCTEISKPGQTPFMRKGEAGQWKTDMSPELVKAFDKWTNENTEGTGLTFQV